MKFYTIKKFCAKLCTNKLKDFIPAGDMSWSTSSLPCCHPGRLKSPIQKGHGLEKARPKPALYKPCPPSQILVEEINESTQSMVSNSQFLV